MKRKAMYMAGISLSFFPLFGCTAVGNYCDNTKPIIKDVSSSENKTKIPGYICELENIESSIHDGGAACTPLPSSSTSNPAKARRSCAAR